MSAIDDIGAAGQSLWLDDLHRSLLDEGELVRRRDDMAVTGITANPTIFERAVSERNDYDDAIAGCGDRAVDDPEAVFWELAVEDVRAAADVLRSTYDDSGGVDGFVSLELAPSLAYDGPRTVAAAVDLFRRLDRPNTMVKVPGTEPGVDAIEELTSLGVNVNVTLLFGVEQWRAVHAAHRRGLEARLEAGGRADVASVASFFLSRIDRQVSAETPPALTNRLAVATARLVYGEWERAQGSDGWRALHEVGAAPQRLLWASTSPKDEELPETHYVERLVAPDTIDTMSWDVLVALADLDAIGEPLLTDMPARDAEDLVAEAATLGIDVSEVAAVLQREGVAAFSDSYDSLLECIRHKARAAA